MRDEGLERVRAQGKAIVAELEGWELLEKLDPDGDPVRWVVAVPIAGTPADRLANELPGHGRPEIHFEQSWPRGRVDVSGEWPQYETEERYSDGRPMRKRILPPEVNGHGSGTVSITVGVDRAPQAAAKDVLRRFVPEYLETWRKTAEACAERERSARRRRAIAERIAAAAGGRLQENGRRVDKVWLPDHGSVEIMYDGDVKLDLGYLDEELALEVLDLVQARRREDAAGGAS